MVNNKNKDSLIMYVNIYAHYPQAYNGAVIGEKIYKLINEKIGNILATNNDCNVYIQSAPVGEEELILIDITFKDNTKEDKKELLEKIKEVISICLNNRIKDIRIKIDSK